MSSKRTDTVRAKLGWDQKKRREAKLSSLLEHIFDRMLETDAEFDRDVGGLRAVLGEDVEAVAVRIAEGEGAGRIVDINITSFRIDPLRGEARELVGHADASVEAGGVAGVLVDGLVGLKLEAVSEFIAFLTYGWCREVRGLVIEPSPDDNVSPVFVRVVKGVPGVDSEGPDVAGSPQLRKRIPILICGKDRRTIINGQQAIQCCGLEAEVVVVELQHDA